MPFKFVLDAFLGTCLSIGLYFATLPAVNKQRQLVTNGLGPLNPYQILYSISSCGIWLVYGFMINNWYVMLERAFGFALYVYYALSCLGLMAISWSKMSMSFGNTYGLQKDILNADMRALCTVQYTMVGIIVVWVIVFAMLFNVYGLDPSVLGQICSINSIGYFLVKTPHLYIIARSKNASSIIAPFMFMDMLCCAAWVMYGIGIKNTNFVYPNIVGLVYSFAYLTLWLSYKNNVPDLSSFGTEVAIATNSGTVGFVRDSSRSRAGLSFDPYRAASNSFSGSDSGDLRSRAGTLDRSNRSASRSGTLEGKDLEADAATASPTDPLQDMKVMPVSTSEQEKDFPASERVGLGFVAALDSVMESLVNIGTSRAHTMLIDPVAAEEIAHVERLNEKLVPELAGVVCTFCDGPVLVDAKFCSTCGTPIAGGEARTYSMQRGGDYSSLLHLVPPPEGSGTKLNPTFDPDSFVNISVPLMPIEEERPSMFAAEAMEDGKVE